MINALIQQILVKFALRQDRSELKSLITQLELMGRFHDNAASLAGALQMKLSFLAGDDLLDVDTFKDIPKFNSSYFKQELHYYQDYEWQLTEHLIKIRLFIKHYKQTNEKPAQKNLQDLIQFLNVQLAFHVTRLYTKLDVHKRT